MQVNPRAGWFHAFGLLASAVLTSALGGSARAEDPAAAAGPPELQKAQQLLQQGSLDQAVALLRQFVSENQDDADAHLMLGSALSLVPRRDEAIRSLMRAIELRPDFAPGYNIAGMTLARLAVTATARKAFEKAIELDPELGGAHLNLALVLAQSGEFAKAGHHLDRAVALEGETPKAAYLHYLRGQLFNEQDMPEQAVAAFEKAIALRADYAGAYLSLGMTKTKLLEDDEALAAIEKAVEMGPGDFIARYPLGVEYLRRGSIDGAVEHLLEAQRLMPDNQAIVYNLTRALHRAGRAEEYEVYREKLAAMIRVSNKARANELKTAEIHNEAVELEASGDLAGALDKYRSILEVDPLNGLTRRNYALLLCRLDRWDEGIDELNEILRQNPDDQNATRALVIAREQREAATAKP